MMTSDIHSVPLCYLRHQIALNDWGSPGFLKTGMSHPSSDLGSKSIILNIFLPHIFYLCSK